MLRVFDLYNYLSTNLPYEYVINEFATSSSDNAAVVRVTPGMSPSDWTHVKRPSFQVVIRNVNQSEAESLSYDIYQHFHNRNKFVIGGTRIVHCSADNSAPLYLRKDENNRYLYSVNFTVTTD